MLRAILIALLWASVATAQVQYSPFILTVTGGGLTSIAPEWLYTNWSTRHASGSATCSQPMIKTSFSQTSASTDLNESAADCGSFHALSPSTVASTSVSYPDGVVASQMVLSTRNGGTSGGMRLESLSTLSGNGRYAVRFYVQYPSGWPAASWDFGGSSGSVCVRQKLGQIDGASGMFFQPELKGGAGELSADLLGVGSFSMNPGDDIQVGSDMNISTMNGQLVRIEYIVDADGWGTSSGTVYDVAVRGTYVTGPSAGSSTVYRPNYDTFPKSGVDLRMDQSATWIINGYMEGICGEGATAPKYGYAMSAMFPANTDDYWIGGACEIEPSETGCP